MRRASINAEIVARRASIVSIDKSFDQKTEAEKNNRLSDLTPESALALVKPFFPTEWGTLTVKDVTLRTIT